MAVGVKSYTLKSGRATCRAEEPPIVVALWKKAPGEMGARYYIDIDGAEDGMGPDGARKIARKLLQYADYIDKRRGRKPKPKRVEPEVSWWFLLDTEEGRDQTLAHAMRDGSTTTFCNLALDDRLGAEGADEEVMEDEEYCRECLEKGAPRTPPPPEDEPEVAAVESTS